jgi:membrane protein DedA with SNARE-associated domain
MSSLIDHILGVPGALVYVFVGLLVFAEDALFVGFVIPGETAAVLGGVDASRGHVYLPLMIVVVVVAAVVGDSVGYEIGRQVGPRILRLRILDRHRRRLDDAQEFLARRGGSAVFLGRFVAFFRAVMPALAGTARMPYRKFLAYNAAGGIVWGTGFVLLGYIAGNSYARVEKAVGRGAALAVLALVLVGLLIWRIRKHQAERRAETEPAPGPEKGHDGDHGSTPAGSTADRRRDQRDPGRRGGPVPPPSSGEGAADQGPDPHRPDPGDLDPQRRVDGARGGLPPR